MIRYETLLLAHTQMTDDELGLVEKQFETLTSDSKGSLSSFDKWGKYRLAYPVRKQDYGVYVLVRFEVPKEAISTVNKQIDTFFRIKCSDFVIRHVTVKLDDNASSVYAKPEPIDAQGTSNFDSFIKENKMEGLLGTKVEAQPKQESAPVEGQQTESAQVEPETQVEKTEDESAES